MIPFPLIAQSLLYAFMGICAAACIYGYSLLGTNDKHGHGLMAIGSAGWAVASPNVFFLLQSLFFLWVAARGYERARKGAASQNH